jgi:hypothetical protein
MITIKALEENPFIIIVIVIVSDLFIEWGKGERKWLACATRERERERLWASE